MLENDFRSFLSSMGYRSDSSTVKLREQARGKRRHKASILQNGEEYLA